MADTSTSRLPSLSSARDWMTKKLTFSLPSLNIGTRLWDNFVEGFAPDRRSYDVCYFPLVHKNADGVLTYFGAFVPDLYELARANNEVNPFEKAILLPKKAYKVEANGLLSPEDLRSVASQVSKTMFALATDARENQQTLNLYHVDRIPAQGLYFNAKSGIAQSLAEAQANGLINVYGGARGTTYALGHIEQTSREKLLHAGLNWLSRGVALISGIGAALAFGPVAPFAAAAAGFTTYYIASSSNQFSFWDKAEDMLKNNWFLSAKHAKPKQLDFVKIAKTLVISAMVGYLALEGGMGAYAEAMNLLTTLPALAGAVAVGSNALLAIKATAGVLAATAGLGAFRGLMWIMHNWMGLGYAKTAVTPQEVAGLPVEKMLSDNNDANTAYHHKKTAHADLDAMMELQATVKSLEVQLKQAQNPCVSKVVALETIFNDLVEKGEINKDELQTPEQFDAAFRKVTALLPMNLGAWAPAQVFHDLSHAKQLEAIEAFKNETKNKRFENYMSSPEFKAYLNSDRFILDRDKFKDYLAGETYKLNSAVEEEPIHDCCSGKKPTNTANEAGEVVLEQPAPEPVQFTQFPPVVATTPVEKQKGADVSLDREEPSKTNPALSRVKAETGGRGSRGNSPARGSSRESSPRREESPSRVQPSREVKGQGREKPAFRRDNSAFIKRK